MTGRAVFSEINLKELSPENRRLFDDSTQKEWNAWQKLQAVEELTEEEIAALPPQTKAVRTRRAHIGKNSKPRLIVYRIAKKIGKTEEKVDKEFPFDPTQDALFTDAKKMSMGSVQIPLRHH